MQKKQSKWAAFASTALLAATLAFPAMGQTNGNGDAEEMRIDEMNRSVEIGTMSCDVVSGSRKNYIVRSTAEVKCKFKPNEGAHESYKGVTGIQLGVDLSVKEGSKLRFVVLSSRAKGTPRAEYALAGKYFGAAASASVTFGIGAAVLVGGNNKKYSMQPLSIETIRGLGLSAGLGFLYLEPDKAS